MECYYFETNIVYVTTSKYSKPWHVMTKRSSLQDPSFCVVSSKVWIQIPVMTPVPLSKALNHNCFVKCWEGSVFCCTSHAPSGEYPNGHPYGL